MHAIWIWGTAIVVYGLFRFWYDGRRGALTPQEIDGYLERLTVSPDADPARLEVIRKFLERDDGREFFMVNLVRLQPGPVASPATGEDMPAAKVLEGYTGSFVPALMRRAGHPSLVARAAGSYVEAWGVEADPGWSFAGVMRYRSRRDMIELVVDPRFESKHAFKLAAVATTLAFPAVGARFVAGPRVLVALVLALIAALVQIAR